MQWHTRYRTYPHWGDTRERWRVFVLPTSVRGVTYWLTVRKVTEEYVAGFTSSFWALREVK